MWHSRWGLKWVFFCWLARHECSPGGGGAAAAAGGGGGGGASLRTAQFFFASQGSVRLYIYKYLNEGSQERTMSASPLLLS